MTGSIVYNREAQKGSWYHSLGVHPSIHCSVGSAPVGVRCCPHHCSPRAVILRLSVEYVNFLSAPLFDVIQPFSALSPSPRFSFHHSKHHLLHQPVVLHPAYVSKQV